MMGKYLVICLIQLFSIHLGYGQKRSLTFYDFDNWSFVDKGTLSDDGKYAAFSIKISGNRGTYLVSTDNSWETIIWNGMFETFISNHQVLIKLKSDSIGIVSLGIKGKIEWIKDVGEYKIIKNKILVFNHKSEPTNCSLIDLNTKQSFGLKRVDDMSVNAEKNAVVFHRQVNESAGDSAIHSIDLLLPEHLTVKRIWAGREKVVNLRISNNGENICFAVSSDNPFQCDFWNYTGRDSTARRINLDNIAYTNKYKILNDPIRFDKNCNTIFFRAALVVDTVKGFRSTSKANMIIRSSINDKVDQQYFEEEQPAFWFMLNTKSLLCNRITNSDEELDFENESSNDYVVIFSKNVDPAERKWNYKKSASLVSLINNQRFSLGDYKDIASCKISPDNQYVLCYDRTKKSFFTFNINNKRIINVTEKIPFSVADEEIDRPHSPLSYSLKCSWLPSDKAVVIYDRYDIWQVDPNGIESPICLTNGYGRKNGIVFRLMYDEHFQSWTFKDKLLLSAIDIKNQNNGFYCLNRSGGIPEVLTMGPYVYSRFSLGPEQSSGERVFLPVKSKDSDIYLVRRESASTSPNFFITRDFKKFRPVTNQYPERSVNWLSSELKEWQAFDGSVTKGILYKPENFDSTKKYPVIFYFYEQLSETLNRYIRPEYFSGPMNIPFFVSNGFLVFVPDIHYKVGETAGSVYNCVVSAANYLSQFSFVDSTKMGIQGHSFGGYEVNTLITSTKIFAAASSACGPSNLFNFYSFDPEHLEHQQLRIGTSPWKAPSLYKKNSPILQVASVTTPVLLMCGMKDSNAPPSETISFFRALKREGKVAWLLIYNEAGHQVGHNDAKDYTKRLVDFFDFYLKNNFSPEWLARDSIR